MKRRDYLSAASVGVVGTLAGCTSAIDSLTGPEFAAAKDPWSEINDHELPNGNEQTGTVTLPAGTYAQKSTNVDIDFTLRIAAKSSAPFDLFVLNQNEFNRYRDQEEFQYLTEFTAFGKRDLRLSGQWTDEYLYIVFDNTAFTRTAPDGEVVANYTVRQTVG